MMMPRMMKTVVSATVGRMMKTVVSATVGVAACDCTQCSCRPQRSSALDDEDEQRKCLADKGWARRSIVIRGMSGSGAANLEELPGREDFPAKTARSSGPRRCCSSRRKTSRVLVLR